VFGFGKKRIDFEDLPQDVRDRLEMLEIEAMEGSDPVETLRKITKTYPGFVPARLNLGMFLLERGDTSAAKETYEAVSKQFPNELGAVAGMATVFVAEGKLEEAEKLANQALAGGYDWPACHGVVAQSKESRGDVEGAADAYLRGYRLSPHSWDFLEHYCRLKGRPFTPPTEEVEPCISMEQLDSLAEFVDRKANTPETSGDVPGCDNTLRFAEQWAAENGVDIIDLYQFLNGHGGFCDCEICLNVTELLDDHADHDA
jgi:tetratricopeptide (TPR) repeat protein